jgi:hypothetical protein
MPSMAGLDPAIQSNSLYEHFLDGRVEPAHGERMNYALAGVIRFIASGMAAVPSGT